MADKDTTTVAPGVTRTDCFWGYFLEGKKEALLRAGLAREEWFHTGERDKRGRAIRSNRFEHQGREIKVLRRNKSPGGRYYVGVSYTARDLQSKELAKAHADAQRKIAALPEDAEVFRADCTDLMERLLHAFTSTHSTSEYTGWRLHPETLGEIERIGGHLRNAIETGKLLFDPAARRAAETRIKAEVAEQDPGLQNFLASLKPTQEGREHG
jgi:hypothetical protein